MTNQANTSVLITDSKMMEAWTRHGRQACVRALEHVGVNVRNGAWTSLPQHLRQAALAFLDEAAQPPSGGTEGGKAAVSVAGHLDVLAAEPPPGAERPVDEDAVRILANRLRQAAGDQVGDFVLMALGDGVHAPGGEPLHYPIANGPNAVGTILGIVRQLGQRPGVNIYFAGSLFKSGSVTERKGRTKDNVAAVLLAVCDFDAKNDPATRGERLPLPAGSEVETSAGNFQCYFWFDRPTLGPAVEHTLRDLASVTGADDCKSIEHVWRMPGTLNWPDKKKIAAGRHPQPFLTRWTIWPEPGLDIVSQHDLDAAIAAQMPAAGGQIGSDPKAVTVPFDWDRRQRPDQPANSLADDQIRKALAVEPGDDRSRKVFGLIRRLRSRHNHSAHETLHMLMKYEDEPAMGHYGEPVNEDRLKEDIKRAYTKGGLPPRHEDVARVHRHVFEEGADALTHDDDFQAPRIEIRGGELGRIVDEAEGALIASRTDIFQRGDQIVRIGETVVEVRGGYEEKDQLLVQVTRPALIDHMTAAARFQRFDMRSNDWKPVNCPPEVADTYLARRGLWKIRPLMGIINAPTLRRDGSLLDRPGYDPASGLFYDPRGAKFPPLPGNPTRDDAVQAVRVLNELIGGFPFASAEDRAVALAGFLTVTVRRVLPAAPLFGIDGTGPGSGKGLLADTIATVGTGRPASAITAGANEEELEKRLSAILLRGDLAVCIDNLDGPLSSSFLCSVLTQSNSSVRRLGQSTQVAVPTNVCLFATANGLTYGGDMWRRGLACLIDPRMENPSERAFAFNPVERAQRNRGRYVAAALTIMLAYQAAGCPPQRGKVMGSFDIWCGMVRDALLWVGEADPVTTVKPVADDPDRERFAAMVLAWQKVIDGQEVTLRKALELARDAAVRDEQPCPDLLVAFQIIASSSSSGQRGDGQIDLKKIGTWFRLKKGQVIYGRRFWPVGETGGAVRWGLFSATGIDTDSQK